MDLRRMRSALKSGKSIYDLPLRVTFYARVSTEKLEQASSLQNQADFYTEFICKNPNWCYVPGYIDEGSGTNVWHRASFLQMIQDGKNGLFDFIVTKEISRFSRSTLDSIHYTQQLLEYDVGVLFQSDGINTLDSDSEFRLVVMAGVAQDEVRKLSERLKFGFHQSIKNGRVLGNDSLWGYDKRNGILTINPQEATVVQLIFTLYAYEKMGIRRVAKELEARGVTGRGQAPFSLSTIRSILRNPKYKGWYCGNKYQSLSYRNKKTAILSCEEWVCHPDAHVPAIVTPALWEAANQRLLLQGSQLRTSGATFQSRYPYSGKIFCQRDDAPFHRRVFQRKGGAVEGWQCSIFKKDGKAVCNAPTLETKKLNVAIKQLLLQKGFDPLFLLEKLSTFLHAHLTLPDTQQQANTIQREMESIAAKRERLLELSLIGALDIAEFKTRSDGFNARLSALAVALAALGAGSAASHHGEQWQQIQQQLTSSLNELADDALLAAAVERILALPPQSKGVFVQVTLKGHPPLLVPLSDPIELFASPVMHP